MPLTTQRPPAFRPDPKRFNSVHFSAEKSRGCQSFAWFSFSSGPWIGSAKYFSLFDARLVFVSVKRKYRFYAGVSGDGQVKLARLVLWLILASQLSGCLLTRVYAFKQQFCDYQANFTLLVDDGVTLKIHRPLLLDSDIIWLIGAEPTTRHQNDNGLKMVYVLEKDLATFDPDYAVPLGLQFTSEDGDYLLNAATIDKNLSAMITPGLIEQTMAHTCDSQTSIFNKSVEFDLSNLDHRDIPTRSQILDALGSPQQTLNNGREIVYHFRLRGAGPKVEKSFARVWFGHDRESVERIRFRYLRYELDADFIAGKGNIAVHL